MKIRYEVLLNAKTCDSSSFHSGDSVKSELIINFKSSQSTEENSNVLCSVEWLSGLLIGQYRLNSPLKLQTDDSMSQNFKTYSESVYDAEAADTFISGLDHQSRLMWFTPMSCSPSNPAFLLRCGCNVRVNFEGKLHPYLPPSFRGSFMRFAYKILICIRIRGFMKEADGFASSSARSMTRLIHLPIKVIPSLDSYVIFSLPSSLQASAHISNERDKAKCDSSLKEPSPANPFVIDYIGNILAESPASSSDSKYDYKDLIPAEVANMISTDAPHPAISARLVYLSKHLNPTNFNMMSYDVAEVNTKKKFTSWQTSAAAAEILSYVSPASFVLVGADGLICRIGLHRTSARLGDLWNGFIDCRGAVCPCLQAIIQLESIECAGASADTMTSNFGVAGGGLSLHTLPVAISPVASHKQSNLPEGPISKVSCEETIVNCANAEYSSFSVPIPLNVTPEFMMRHVSEEIVCSLSWQLHFVFKTLLPSPPSLTDSSLLSQFSNLPMVSSQTYSNFQPTPHSWRLYSLDIPVHILPNGFPSLFPTESSLLCDFNALIT